VTEPYFETMNSLYEVSSLRFLKRRWWATAIIGLCLLLIVVIGTTLQSELAPLDDRNFVRVNVTARKEHRSNTWMHLWTV